MTQSKSIFSRDFWILATVNFLVMTAYYGLMVTTAQFAVARFHAATSIAGLVAGITVIGILFSRFASGYLTQHFTTKALLMSGALLLIPATLAYSFTNSIGMLIVVRLVHGLAIGLISTVTNTAVVLLFPPARKGEGIGYFSLSTIIATAIGPFLGLLLMGISFSVLFNVVSVSAVLACLTAFTVNAKRIVFHRPAKPEPLNWRAFIEPKVLPITVSVFIIGLSYAALQAYISFFAATVNLSALASYFFLVYAAAVLFSRPLTGRLLDRHSENLVMIPAVLIEVVGLFVLARATNGITFMLAAVLIGLGFGNFQSAAQTVVAKMVPTVRLSQATATYFIVFDLSLGVGPFGLGLVAPHVGYANLFAMCGLLSLLGLVCYYFLHGRHAQFKLPVNHTAEVKVKD